MPACKIDGDKRTETAITHFVCRTCSIEGKKTLEFNKQWIHVFAKDDPTAMSDLNLSIKTVIRFN